MHYVHLQGSGSYWKQDFSCRVSLPQSAQRRSTSAAMTDNKRLAFSIIQFLHDQLQSGTLSSDAQESLEGESSDMKKKNMKLLSSFLSWLRMHT